MSQEGVGCCFAEREIGAMSQHGLGVHFTHLPLNGSPSEQLFQMQARANEAAQLLADSGVDQIIFHCTAVTTFDADAGRRISQSIRARTGVDAFSTSEAIVAALVALEASHIALVTPYIEEIHAREKAFLAANGISVVADSRMDVDAVKKFGHVNPLRSMSRRGASASLGPLS
jgi:maleate cis-trans isomerase